MFFKRSKKNNPPADADIASTKSDEAEAASGGAASGGAAGAEIQTDTTAAMTPPAVPPHPPSAPQKSGHASRFRLKPTQLRNGLSAGALGFADTASLDADTLPPVNERAVSAIRLALALHEGTTHVLAVGASNTGLREMVVRVAEAETMARAAPSDWIYVTNFADPAKPRALRLPSGTAHKFATALSAAVCEVAAALNAAFHSDDYQARHRAIHERFRGTQDEAFETLQLTAREQNIAVLRAPTGYALAPTLDGKVVKPEIFAKLPPTMQADVNKKIEKLKADLATILSNEPKAERARRMRLAELDADIAEPIVSATLEEFLGEFSKLDGLESYLAELAADMVEHVALFRDTHPANADEGAVTRNPQTSQRYGVLVIGDGEPASSPVHVFDPLSQALAGTIAGGGNRSGSGPHLFQLRPGILHIANGGVLVIEAGDLLSDPAERQALREALRSGRIGFRRGRGPERAAALASLDPEPVPLEVTVIVIADPQAAEALQACDPALTALLSARAGFADTIAMGDDACSHFARLVAMRSKRDKLRPVTADAVACLIEEAVRDAPAPGRIALHVDALAALLREADARAAGEARAKIERSDVALAADETRRRAWSPAPLPGSWPGFESHSPGIAFVNYLSTPPLICSGGQPSARSAAPSPACPVLARVTACLAAGEGRPGDFVSCFVTPRQDKNLQSSSPLVWSALKAMLGPETPIPLTALLFHEHDGDGRQADAVAGSHRALAELCALVSALTQAPVQGRIALAATLSPSGGLGPLPRVNDAIEFAFDAAAEAGLLTSLHTSSGDGGHAEPAGVVIAACDQPRLMLASRVIEAVERGTFDIWVAEYARQAFSILSHGETAASGQAGTEAETGGKGSPDEPVWMPRLIEGMARFAPRAANGASRHASDAP